MLQREYHCYNSARLEAAVEALEKGVRIEEVPIRELHHRSQTYGRDRVLIVR
jgi:hypothetical protein